MAKTMFRIAGLSVLAACNSAFASGVFLQEATYANMGTAGAGDAVYTGSAASIWSNPAIMSHMDKEHTTISGLLLNLDVKYEGEGTEGHSNTTMPIASFYHVMELNEKLKLGLAFSTLGGATLDYGDGWQGENQLTDVALLTYQFNPSLSYAISDKLSIAAGLQVDYALFQQSSALAELDTADDFAYGYNLGVVFQATDKARIGLSYRSKIEHEFDGDSTVSAVILKQTVTRTGTYSTEFILPATADLSLAYQMTDRLDLMTSVQWHQWSDMQSTDVDLTSPEGTLSINREWQDVWRASIGGEYQLTSSWSLKAGYAYETSPIDDPANQSPDLPVGEQHRYSVGVSKAWTDSKLDIYYEFADFGEMDIEQTGKANPLDGVLIGHVHFVGMAYTF
ncbi:OmpP1/FadL family transporter [Vibrio paucivorans]